MLTWSESYVVGVEEIDRDHRRMFDIVTDVERAAEAGEIDQCGALIDDFLKASADHFANEEKLLRREGYPDVDEHARYHGLMLDKAKSLHETCAEKTGAGRMGDCYMETVSLLLDDIVRGDSQIKSYLQHRRNR